MITLRSQELSGLMIHGGSSSASQPLQASELFEKIHEIITEHGQTNFELELQSPDGTLAFDVAPDGSLRVIQVKIQTCP